MIDESNKSNMMLVTSISLTPSLNFKMDIKSLSELLKGTLDPAHRNKAEKKLTEVQKIIMFGPVLLQVTMSTKVELPVRQAAFIYLKNMVSSHWSLLLHYSGLIIMFWPR